jgi:prephenate dehydrogenase
MAFCLNKLAIFGVGLIGGSFSLALRGADRVNEVVGVGRSIANLKEAVNRGVIDRVSDAREAVKDADLVLLAVPVGQMASVMQAIAPHLGPDTIVTDGGSTKQDVVALARQYLPDHLANFVPGHPIAGAEKSGVTAALPGLYQNRQVVLTPLPETRDEAIDLVAAAWYACGARVAVMPPQDHDRIFAAVSHLPHMLSFALVNDIAGRNNAAELFSYAASGFRDFTRIAGSSPEMWRDICMSNRDALLGEVDTYLQQLTTLREALANHDATALESAFTQASIARNEWGKEQK